MRKELDLDIEAEIRVELTVADDRVAELIDERRDLVAEEVRAGSFEEIDDGGHRRTWEIEGIDVEIAIEPLSTTAA